MSARPSVPIEMVLIFMASNKLERGSGALGANFVTVDSARAGCFCRYGRCSSECRRADMGSLNIDVRRSILVAAALLIVAAEWAARASDAAAVAPGGDQAAAAKKL